MNIKNFVVGSVVLIFCLFGNSFAAAQGSGELSILSSNLGRPAISELIPMFERLHKVKIKVQYANNPILKQQIESGAKFDVVIIEPKMLAELAEAGFADKTSIADLAKVGMALVSKKGSAVVDISSVELFKKVLLSAHSVAYTADGHSGAVFLSTLEKIGITGQMKPKLVPVVGRFSTVDVAEGRAQFTAFPRVGLSAELQIAGMFPEEIQTYIGISAAAGSHTAEPEAVRTFIEYLQSESSMTLFKSLGYTPAASTRVGVPIEKEPMHRLKFENEFVRLFDVLVPVGETTKYHVHLYDGVGVRVSDAQIIDEEISGEKKPLDVKHGIVTFGARPSPLTHRVINSGKSDFRNIFIELLAGKNAATTNLFPILSDGHVILIDNERVRVNRLTLKPGESSKMHIHPMHGLGIILYDSKIELVAPDGSKRKLEPKAGDHAWQNAGTTHVIKNIGQIVFEAIDIELKQ